MRRFRTTGFLLLALAGFVAVAEVQVIDGKRVECRDGVCRLVEDVERVERVEKVERDEGVEGVEGGERTPRIAQGYMTAEKFVAFLEKKETNPLDDAGLWLTLLLVFLGGMAMNLTPCMLPMIPINLIVIGRSAKRGAAYGLGMAMSYGTLGVAAAVGGLAFGDIQGNPWFNGAVALVFLALALALFDVWFLDLSRFRGGVVFAQNRSGDRFSALGVPFGMGALSAVLAGACVAPVLVSVLLLTGKLYAEGHALALGLPFVLGVGMALPWPFLGAGLHVLPKPGAWMKQVNRLFGLVVVGFAVYYGSLAWKGFHPAPVAGRSVGRIATPAMLPKILSARRLSRSAHPLLFDCWASWCKNCTAMELRVMPDVNVQRALEPYEVIRVQAEDLSELRKVKGFESVRGLPAFVVFE